MTNSISELVDADVLFIIGSNPTEAHPVIGAKIRQARNRGAKLVVADPRLTDVALESEVHLRLTPGTNVALLNGMMNHIINEGLLDKEYVENRTEGFEELRETVKDYTPEKVAEICGLNPEDIKRAAELYAKADKAPIVYCLGITEHSTGTTGVMSVANLALLCGKVGKYACGVNPLRGQNNVQGACDMGCMPTDFPGYQKVANPEALAKFEKLWQTKLSSSPGLTSTDAMTAAGEGKVRCLYIFGENPMVSDPNIGHVEHALKKCDLVIVQDIFLTETAELADVVLPATSYAEKDGTFTNSERRVQRVRRAVSGPGESRDDWEIFSQVAHRLGYDNKFTSAEEILDEIAQVTPSYGGFSFDRLEREQPQWPCPTADHPGTPILHIGKFSRGERALFKPSPYVPSAELPDEEYPLILSTGRILYHYHTMTMTGRSEGIQKIAGRSFVEINPADAKRHGIENGGRIKLASRRAEIEVDARVTERVPEGVLYMPFHYADGAANWLTSSALDPISRTPEYKVTAIRVERA